MGCKNPDQYTTEDILQLINQQIDYAIIVDAATDTYRSIIRKGFLTNIIKETGSYTDLIQELLIHINATNDRISDGYQVFLPSFGKFSGKYSKNIKIKCDDQPSPHIIQLTIYPLDDEDKYLFIIDELDNGIYIQEFNTQKKVNIIEKTFLFSMLIDLNNDTTSGINISEISDESVNSSIKYSEWRNMIVNMFDDEDKEEFLHRTDPEYLKAMVHPGRTSSYDCLMQNLEGVFIWVKLIFSRVETGIPDDYKYVFMVQNINEEATEIFSALQKYGEMAITDPLTGVFNRGRIETEVHNAITIKRDNNSPVSLMILDIDYFKRINDTYGHASGDRALKLFSWTIQEFFKNDNYAIGRWGGEEFVVVLYGKNEAQAYKMADQLRITVAEAAENRGHTITCSIGVTELRDSDNLQKAYTRMDKALYTAKKEGRNKVKIG